MRDKELYAQILGLSDPWFVEEVELLNDKKEVVIRVGLRGSIVLVCPCCNEPMPGYDSRKRRWRHLDTCQYKTIIEGDVPRGQCPMHGVKQIGVPWAEERSQFTALFERLAIDWLKGTAQSCVAERLGLSWDEVHGIMERAVDRGLQRPLCAYINETTRSRKLESNREGEGAIKRCFTRKPFHPQPTV